MLVKFVDMDDAEHWVNPINVIAVRNNIPGDEYMGIFIVYAQGGLIVPGPLAEVVARLNNPSAGPTPIPPSPLADPPRPFDPEVEGA